MTSETTPSYPQSALETLIMARGKIDTPEKWIQGELAKNNVGQNVGVRHPYACKFCMEGSLQSVTPPINFGETLYPPYRDARLALFGKTGQPITGFNDAPERTHGEILMVFDMAIADLKKKEQGS